MDFSSPSNQSMLYIQQQGLYLLFSFAMVKIYAERKLLEGGVYLVLWHIKIWGHIIVECMILPGR